MKISNYWSHFLRGWKSHMISQTTTVLVLSGCFLVLVGFFVITKNLNLFLSSWGGGSQVSFFLEDELPQEKADDLINKIKKYDFINKVKLRTKEDTATQFIKDIEEVVGDMLSQKDLIESMPTTIEASIIDSIGTKEKIEKLEKVSQELLGQEGITEVSYGQAWLEKYKNIVQSFSSSTLFFAIVLILGSLLIVSNAIKSSVYQRQDEITILELVGATPKMISAPFIFEGLLLGLLAAVVSLIIGFIVFKWEIQILQDHFGIFGLGKGIIYLSFMQVLFFLIFGGLIGALGSLISVKRLRQTWRES